MKKLSGIILCALAVGLWTMPAAAQDKDLQELGEFIAHYYQNPEPDRVPGMLQMIVDGGLFNREDLQKNDAVFTLAYSFGRIGQLHPPLVEEYKRIYETAPDGAKNFLARVLLLTRAPDIADFIRQGLPEEEPYRAQLLATLTDQRWQDYSPLAKEVTHPTDLDMLWTEFMVTGNEEAVGKIIDVMAWPDLLRERINAYLNSEADQESKDRITGLLRDEMDVRIDPETRTVVNKDDISYAFLLLLRSGRLSADTVGVLKDALNITDEEFFNAATKGSAIWSVGSNAVQHEKVLQICMREADRREGPVRVGLLQAVGMPLMAQQRYDEAYSYMDRLAQLTPDDPRPQYSKARILLAQKNLPAFREQVALMKERKIQGAEELSPRIRFLELDLLDAKKADSTEDVTDTAGLLKQWEESAARLKDYRTYMVFDGANERVIEWEAEVVLPDRFSVMQSAVRDGQAMYDRWTTVGDETFIKIGMWMKMPDENDMHTTTNELIRAAKWLTLVSDNGIRQARRVQIDGHTYLVLTVDAANMESLTFFDETTSVELTGPAELWLDAETSRLLKAGIDIHISNPDGMETDMRVSQFFDGYDAGRTIEPPKDYMNVNKDGEDGKSIMP